jgi:hypothetical protein
VQPPSVAQEPLPVYRLQDVPVETSEATRVEVRTPGAQVSVQGELVERDRQSAAFVIDARVVSDPLQALQFDWSSPDGAAEVRVSIQASDDLDRWRTLVPATTLVHVRSGTQALQRYRVAIPSAERVLPTEPIEPAWFAATQNDADEVNAIEFDAERHAPVAFARIQLAEPNTSFQVALESRAEAKAPWTQRWSGEVYWIISDSEQRLSPPAQFPPTADAHWRVRLMQANDVFAAQPSLELGYRPARLRFLAKGAGPYTLAFGSRRAEPASARACDSLLGNLSPEEREQNLGEGYVGAERTLGGDHALRPLPKKTPLRQVILWGVLIFGVGVLIALALSLLRRIRPEGNDG